MASKEGMYFTLEPNCDIQHSALLQRRQKTTKKMVRADAQMFCEARRGDNPDTRFALGEKLLDEMDVGLMGTFYEPPYSPLRGMPEVPHSLSDWLQPLP